ncbi:FUSC family protein [Allokutzneria oryzae]|uniref:Aromatic acid exporter family protein n=1 Tax=Allokutzneria oryzae TaxID=1378989 RepID=A0ABV5ZV92_9PSEU
MRAQRVAAPYRWLKRAFGTPGNERLVLVQAVKAALAAMVAWLVSSTFLGLPQAHLAPYAAVFAVEFTVTATLWSSLHQIASVTSAVLVAAVAELVLPWRTLEIGVAVLVGLLVGRSRIYGESGQWVGLTALLILAWGTGSDPAMLGDRLVETALGLGVGTIVNVLVFPPFYARPARESSERLATQFADLLAEIARELRRETPSEDPPDWTRRARGSAELVRKAERAVEHSRRSRRLNARRESIIRHGPAEHHLRLLGSLRVSWPHLHQIAEVLKAAASAEDPVSYPDRCSRRTLSELLSGFAGMVRLRVSVEHHDLRFDEIRQRCEELLAELTEAGPPGSAGMVVPARRMLQELADR